MKKFILAAISILFLVACNNNSDNSKGMLGNDKAPKTQADSLMADVMDGHDVGMGKMSKISKMQNEITRVLDSIAKLPAKAQQAVAPYKAKLDSLKADLVAAEMAMDKWMTEFNMDSAVNNVQERIKYLADEKLKVGKVKETILNSLQKADSLLKAKI